MDDSEESSQCLIYLFITLIDSGIFLPLENLNLILK